MKIQSIQDFDEWFEVLQTTDRSQVAIMELAPGQETGKQPEAHENSDQVLLVIRGAVEGVVGGEKVSLQEGQFLIIPANTQHKFTNRSTSAALTFNVYAPPAYPPNAKG